MQDDSFKTAILKPYHPSDEPRSFGGAMLRMAWTNRISELPCIPSIESMQNEKTPWHGLKASEGELTVEQALRLYGLDWDTPMSEVFEAHDAAKKESEENPE